MSEQDNPPKNGRRLVKVEGVGPLAATALVGAIGSARQFTNGRELSAWLGLVPRERSSGNRTMLLGISQRGSRYLRTLLIHGARAAARVAERKRDARSVWLSRLKLRGGQRGGGGPGQQERASAVGTVGAQRLLSGADRSVRGLTGENQELEHLPKVAKVVLQC